MAESEFRIDKGVPLPRARNERNRHRLKYPWHDMEVGDSFFVPGVKQGSMTIMRKGEREWRRRFGSSAA